MKLKLKHVFSIIFLSTALIACGGGEATVESPPAITEETLVDVSASATETSAPTKAPAEEVVEEPTAPSEPVVEAEAQEEALPLYLSAELLDVNHGESFRIADLTGQGKYVLVEMMAVW